MRIYSRITSICAARPGVLRYRPTCWQRSTRSSARASAEEHFFEQWLKEHPLPGAAPVAPQLQWHIQRGVLVGTDAAKSAAVFKLHLPQAVAGLFPALEEILQPTDSPLPRPPTAVHDTVLAVLARLAAHASSAPPVVGLQGAAQAGIGQHRQIGSASGPGGNIVERRISRATFSTPRQEHSHGSDGAHSSSGCGAAPGMIVAAVPQLHLGSQLLVLLSADSAALGVLREGSLVQHKVLTGYTVRRKQGKSQLTYERRGGGPHSVGGSIRSREARRLFQAAAEKLQDWAPSIAACNQLYRGGTVRVWNELFASRDPPAPLDRGDPRWRDVGVGVRRPRLEDLERVRSMLVHGVLEELAVDSRGEECVTLPA